MPTVRLYLPKDAQNYRGALERLQRDMSDATGGLTMWDAEGRWVDDDGEIVTEETTVLQTECTYVWDDARDFGRDLARTVVELTDETEVVGAVGGEKFTVRSDD